MISYVTQSKGASPTALIRNARRVRLFNDAEGKCFYCGGPVFEQGCNQQRDWLMLNPVASLMVREHKIPTIRGGSNEPENVVCACRGCNAFKGAFTTDEFRVLMAFRRGDLNFRFPGEDPSPVDRDWLVCHSGEGAERDLVIHNMPAAAKGYAMRNARARGPKRVRA